MIAVSFTRVSGFSMGMPLKRVMIVSLDEPRPMTNRPGYTCPRTFAVAANTDGARVYTGVTATPTRILLMWAPSAAAIVSESGDPESENQASW